MPSDKQTLSKPWIVPASITGVFISQGFTPDICKRSILSCQDWREDLWIETAMPRIAKDKTIPTIRIVDLKGGNTSLILSVPVPPYATSSTPDICCNLMVVSLIAFSANRGSFSLMIKVAGRRL